MLAECCRRLQEAGVPTAWVLLDEHDEPAVLDIYIAYALRRAAADAAPVRETRTMPGAPEARGTEASRTAFAMRDLAARDGPFVLVFDELERLANPDSAALVDFVLRRGPPNLHLAFACRELPAGVHVAGAVLEGHGAILSDDDLRFSRVEIARFFKGKLTQARLGALMSESAGWPFALRIVRNEVDGDGPQDAPASRQFVDNWVETRLFAGLGAEEREFLLDIGLFEWLDAALLDEVLQRSDSMLRIETMSVLVGMLEPLRNRGTDVWRLHPLIREHCVRQRFRQAPQRFRAVHRRIADALVRRGHTVAAMRHAIEAGEAALAGDILERAGGVRLMLREGVAQLRAADRALSEDVIAARPRLALVRCASLMLSGRMAEAKQRYRSIEEVLGEVDGDASDAALALAVEHCIVRGMIPLYGGARISAELIGPIVAANLRLARSPRVDVLTRATVEYNLCTAGSMMANFGPALDHAARARQCIGQSRFLTMFVDVQEGQIAMAQGRVRDAAALYQRAERVARESFTLDPVPAALCSALLQELALERYGAVPGADPTRVAAALATGSTPFQSYAAASAVVVEVTLIDKGVERALAAVQEMLDHLCSAQLSGLVRYLSALRISLLAVAGRVADGERAWARDDLPFRSADCLDLDGQTWREMEAIACARLRLTITAERFEEGRGFAEALCAAAAARGLKRTLMRALALCAVLEVRAGDAAAAHRHLEAYLRLYAETPYAGALLRERAHYAQALASVLGAAAGSPLAEAANALRVAVEHADQPRQSALSTREREVLERLGARRDKHIAAELGLSTHGVRYHLRKLFAKLGARNRAEAVRLAQERGLVAGSDAAGVAALPARTGRAPEDCREASEA